MLRSLPLLLLLAAPAVAQDPSVNADQVVGPEVQSSAQTGGTDTGQAASEDPSSLGRTAPTATSRTFQETIGTSIGTAIGTPIGTSMGVPHGAGPGA